MQVRSMINSIVERQEISYPASDDFFSPHVNYPEYQFEHIASKANDIYAMVRQLLAQAGLDAARFRTAAWNPLGQFIQNGSSVFVLCNFVYHRRPNESMEDFWAKCTHGSVLRAVIDYVLLAVGSSGRIIFGNAPLQSCKWERVLADSRANTVLDFYKQYSVKNVQAKDLRLFVSELGTLGQTRKSYTYDSREKGINIDLGQDSMLAQLSEQSDNMHFRVTDYDPRTMESYHSANSHLYVINREILKSDVVLSLPKLKTHEKVGVTCGLKGFVGTVALKDCLAHHRFGGSKLGGDEYPDGSYLRYLMSRFHDLVCSRANNTGLLQNMLQIMERTLRRFISFFGAIQAGGWYGNDTCWRMALDLARIAYYANTKGVMQNTPQRVHILLIDGIIAGEGDGPLSPVPVKSGTLLFSDNVAMGDRIACKLMGFDYLAIPLIREAFYLTKFVLYACADNGAIIWNGEEKHEKDIKPVLLRSFLPPRGWQEYLGKKL